MNTAVKQISLYQVKMVHVLKNALGLSEETYRERIQNMHGFSGTCKDLSHDEAEFIISRWKAEAIEKGVWKNYRGIRSGGSGDSPESTASPVILGQSPKKYDDLGSRPGMATPRQLRMIEAMWAGVSRTHKEDHRQRALRKFIFRITHVEDMRFLENWQVQKIVKALEKMKAQKEGI